MLDNANTTETLDSDGTDAAMSGFSGADNADNPGNATQTYAVPTLNLKEQSMRQEYLTLEEEQKLARAWRDDQDYDARDRLIRSHLRIACSFISKGRNSADTDNDLFQESVMALTHALDKFDPDKGFRFSTYARTWIRANVTDSRMRYATTVRIKSSSKNRRAFYNLPHIDRSTEQALRNKDQEATITEINAESARKLGMTPENLMDLRNSVPKMNSLNVSISHPEGDIGEKIDMLVCDAPSAEEICIESNAQDFARKVINEALSVLNERERRIVEARGMSLKGLTLGELADEFGISRERIRQIQGNAFKKLRTFLATKGIRDTSFLDSTT